MKPALLAKKSRLRSFENEDKIQVEYLYIVMILLPASL